MLFRFCLYGFLKNQRYFEPFLMLIFLDRGLSFFVIGLLLACRDLTVNLLEIPSGALADSFGRRGAMVVSFVAYIVSFFVLGTATNTALLFLGMTLYGVGDTFRTGTHKAMIFEWLRLQGRSEERTSIYGFTRSWSQIGSALSGVIAAIFVLVSGSYAYVFYFAIVPYVANLVNLATYPKTLDGDHPKAQSIVESMARLKQSLVKAIKKRDLRRLVLESMSWEGYFNAIKDYLQPVLQSVAVLGIATVLASQSGDRLEGSSPQLAGSNFLNDAQKTALLIGPVYAVLFLLSAWASRNANRLVERSGGEESSAQNLWVANLILFCVITIAAWYQFDILLVIAFLLLHMLKNFWRPILVTRFDSHSEASEGATILSIESQAQRLSTLIFAPLLGWAVDCVRSGGSVSEFWPIGACGMIVAAVMIVTSRRKPAGP